MRLFAKLPLANRLSSLWNGPEDLPRNLKLEWRFVAVRWLGIASLAPILLLAHLPTERLIAAYAVLFVASVYNAGLQRVMPRRPQWLANGYVSTIGDALLDIAMVIVGGGFDSPFYFIQQAEAALQERLRQSNTLNEATAALGASLELDAVLRAAVGATAQLFGSPTAVLQASTGLDGHAAMLPTPTFYAGDGQSGTERALERLCQHYAQRGLSSRNEELISIDRLPTGEQAVVLELALPTRQISLATLAVAVPFGATITLDSDILDSFVERITLAVENASLYRTLADRSQDLQRAYSDLATAHQELLSVDEMKTNFLANVSHELRTPLTSIRSFSELLLAYEDDPSVQKEFLRIISTESERLTRLVNDVLDISRIEAGHMDWKMDSIDVAELLTDLGRTFSPLVSLAQLSFDIRLDENLAWVYGDRDRLHQVVANLLNNAMKFTRPGGTIVLRGEIIDDEMRVTVSDTGIGVATADQQRIFEKFQQVGDTLTDKPRGTGLGLAICRDIVEHHQGRMWVDSLPGVGSTFAVALPSEPEPVARAA